VSVSLHAAAEAEAEADEAPEAAAAVVVVVVLAALVSVWLLPLEADVHMFAMPAGTVVIAGDSIATMRASLCTFDSRLCNRFSAERSILGPD
jgi:hypothetical protein